MQSTVTGASNIVDCYKKADEQFKANVKTCLTQALADQEELDRKNALPHYMCWRPKHYQDQSPKRAALYLTEALKT
jgi:hypothetical protein